MSKTTLQEEIRQSRPFASTKHEAQLSIIRTGSMLMDAFERMLKPYGITGTQYNVLRILRGADPTGLCRNEIRDRMVARMPDVTRLLDRMEVAGFVSRNRLSEDRRMVRTRITPKGHKLLDDLEAKARMEQERPFDGMSAGEITSLIGLLASVRDGIRSASTTP